MLKPFLSNKHINSLNFHHGLVAFSNGFGSLFIGVFLYQAGIPLWQIFVALAATLALRIVARPLSLKMCLRFGLKKILIFGTILFALNYPLLGQIENIDIWFFIFFIEYALTDIFYWLPYHTIYSILGDNELRGKQTSLRDGIIKIAEFLAPTISGILVITVGYQAAFLSAMIIMIISLIPIIKIPKIDLSKYSKYINSKKPIQKEGFWLYLGDGFFFNHDFVWKLILFLIVVNPAYFGGLVGFTILIQFILHLFVGHFFDNGNGRIISRVGALIVFIAIVGRGLLVTNIIGIIISDIIFAIGLTLYMPIFNSALYNFSKSSSHPLLFHYYAETGWDIGGAIAALLTALIVYLNNDLRLAMMISTIGLILTNYILTKYFARH